MIEQVEFNKYPLIESIGIKREELKLERIDINLLKIQAGNQDPQIASHAQRVLKTKWELEPECDAIQAKSIDINEQLAPFSENELKIMFDNMVAVQLTEGCNGNCSFCFFGIKRGVSSKYSFDSLSNFFQQHSDKMTDHSFVLYWDSDPFDYRDGDNSFIDVYKLYRETLPHNYNYISTAIPRGGEYDFIKFMSYLASIQDTTDVSSKCVVPVRISVSQQNIQRVEATLSELSTRLLNSGYSQSEINKLHSTMSTVDRVGDYLLPIGPLIQKADDIKNTYSTACRDGVILTPSLCQAIMLTAATVYEPSGQKNIDLIPGQVQQQVPSKVRDELYAIWILGQEPLTERISQKQTMVPIITYPNGCEYSLPDIVEDLSLKLGREVASYVRLLSNFSKISRSEIDSPKSISEKDNFLLVSTQVFRERQIHTQNLLSSTEQFCDSTMLLEDEQKRLKYYLLLTNSYLTKMDFLANQVEQGQPLDTISRMAVILTHVGRNQIDKLSTIMDWLSKEGDNITLSQFDPRTVQTVITGILMNPPQPKIFYERRSS